MNTWGTRIKLTVFGESRGALVGIVIDGYPAGVMLDDALIAHEMRRRAPHGQVGATPRTEPDEPEIVSGVLNGITTGAPITALIKNKDARPDEAMLLRPGHADYPAFIKYEGFADLRGGGMFSGRLTAPLVFAGALCRLYLASKGIVIGGHILSVGDVCDRAFGEVVPELLNRLAEQEFPVLNAFAADAMRARIEQAQAERDSVGARVEVAATGVPAGLGDPLMYSMESVLSSLLFSIPGVKSVEFGLTNAYERRGSEYNDELSADENGAIQLLSNNAGGINGGITNGMPVVLRVGLRPPSSIARQQRSVCALTRENAVLELGGRNDCCLAARTLPVVEAAVSIAIMEMSLE